MEPIEPIKHTISDLAAGISQTSYTRHPTVLQTELNCPRKGFDPTPWLSLKLLG